MATPWTWRKMISAALFALVIAFVGLGPSVEAVICPEEGAAVAAEFDHSTIAAPDAPVDQHETGGQCIHGHCHHVVPFAPPSAAEAGAPAVTPIQQTSANDQFLRSDPKFSLKRPPRA